MPSTSQSFIASERTLSSKRNLRLERTRICQAKGQTIGIAVVLKWEQNAQVEDKRAKISHVRMGGAAITGNGQDTTAHRDLEYMIPNMVLFQ